MKPYNYQAVWADYSEWVLQKKNDKLGFHGQLNFTEFSFTETRNDEGEMLYSLSLMRFLTSQF